MAGARRLPLLVLSLAAMACGGRIEDIGSTPSGGDELVAPDDPGAPPTPSGVAPPPSSSSALGPAPSSPSPPAAPACACAAVTLTCDGKHGYASSDQTTCSLDMSRRACTTLGITAGTVAAPGALMSLSPSFVNDADAAYALCALVHEAQHTCIDIRKTTHCASEVDAYARTLTCFDAIRAARCVAPAPSWCARLDDFVAATRAAQDFNACLCAAGTTCASCRAACFAAGGGSTCADAARLYCKVNGK